MRLINKHNYDCLENEFTKKAIEGFEYLNLINDLIYCIYITQN